MRYFVKFLLLTAGLALFSAALAFADDTISPDRGWDGFWLLEKTVVEGVEPDDPKLAGFYNRFDEVAFEVRKGKVFFSNGCAAYIDHQDAVLTDFFEKALYDRSPAEFKAQFNDAFDVELPDNLTVWTFPWCELIHAEMLVVPEKLFLVDEGLFYGAYKKVDPKEYLRITGLEMCPEGNAYTIEMGQAMQYVFFDMTLEQVYADMLMRYPLETQYLRKELPSAGMDYDSGVNGTAWISYTYKGVRDLVVEMQFDAGVVTLEITEYDGVCLAYVIHAAN